VLEGKQGAGKSTAVKILAGEENFSDRPILHADARTQQEALQGRWLVEFGELAGMRRADTETLKNFLSSTEDSGRPAYGRFRKDQKRRCVFVGTTNTDDYLSDPTGNRRFWPVKVGRINLEALKWDREQLFAEAVLAEAKGEPLGISSELYDVAAREQDARVACDPWEDLLADVKGICLGGSERISSAELLKRLSVPAERATALIYRRLAAVMGRLDWQGPKKMKLPVNDPYSTQTDAQYVAQQGYYRAVAVPTGAE
jgi:predicted P-loop ATPase